jgi:hypothetical protein
MLIVYVLHRLKSCWRSPVNRKLDVVSEVVLIEVDLGRVVRWWGYLDRGRDGHSNISDIRSCQSLNAGFIVTYRLCSHVAS